ncbi:MAG TPA: hypothetical protein DIW80_19465 [Gordonia polyisoprenivorans]|uniref:hypothetical protein n=1 Tax=uncultured Gordonia sp. TaxID=198437 RepID=UPI000EE25244|nr:hypothetical protein [uncultured Gordonia sp.]HCS59063.1 hypothetical protein [Gordonia polyisoprenivorans]
MTTTTADEQIGPQLAQPDRIRGWLVFGHLPPDLQKSEDQTRWADMRERAAPVRPVTGAEILLLEHLGYDTTRVTQTVVHGRHRCWPTLELPRTRKQANALRKLGYTDPIPTI